MTDRAAKSGANKDAVTGLESDEEEAKSKKKTEIKKSDPIADVMLRSRNMRSGLTANPRLNAAKVRYTDRPVMA